MSGLDQELLSSLPVDGPFDSEELRRLAAFDLGALADAMRRAPVDGPFTPGEAVTLAECPNLDAALDVAAAASAREQGPIDPSTFVELALGTAP